MKDSPPLTLRAKSRDGEQSHLKKRATMTPSSPIACEFGLRRETRTVSRVHSSSQLTSDPGRGASARIIGNVRGLGDRA